MRATERFIPRSGIFGGNALTGASRDAGRLPLLLEIGKAVSLLLSILSLDALLTSAFFVPGSPWDERLLNSLERIVLAACVCFASGLLFNWHRQRDSEAGADVLRTLPVRLFFWALAGMVLLFVVSWYLEEYYVPMLWRNQPH
jgi:hypothetical protein